MLKKEVHEHILKNQGDLHDWFSSIRKALPLPFYTSVDVRDAFFKVASVDANIYPAGFNNICPTDKENAPEIVKDYLNNFYGDSVKKIGLLSEEHTKNAFYWENIYWLKELITQAGYEVKVLFPRDLNSDIEVESSSGKKITVEHYRKDNGHLHFKDGFVPDLIISNNDFSQEHKTWANGLTTPINPARELGWFQRKKSDHFKYYNELARDFARVIKMDPWGFEVQTELYPNFNLSDETSRNELADRVEKMLSSIQESYKKRGIGEKPSVFVKNNSGTYGLAVLSATSSEEVRNWNNKTRTKMKAAKGGADVSEVVIQEGIPSFVRAEGDIAEPVIYIIGCDLAGGFLRTHHEKGPIDNLNSPGAVYKKMCVADLKIDPTSRMLENVYGWVARLSSLAIGKEMKALKIKMPGGCFE